MPNRRWFERAETAWGCDWRFVGGVFRDSFILIFRSPIPFVLLAAVLLLSGVSWKLLPLQRMYGWQLSVVASGVSFLLATVKFCVLLIGYHVTVNTLRGRRVWPPANPLQRAMRALPYGIGVYLLYNGLSGWLWYGLNELGANCFSPILHSLWFDISEYLAFLPTVYLVCRYGFVIVGIASGDDMSLRRADTLSHGRVRPLVYTALLWFSALQLPVWVVRVTFDIEGMQTLNLNWLFLINRPVFTVFFAVVAAVWYEKVHALHRDKCTVVSAENMTV